MVTKEPGACSEVQRWALGKAEVKCRHLAGPSVSGRFGVCWGGSIKSKLIRVVRVALACLVSVTSVDEHLGFWTSIPGARGQLVLRRD